MNYFPVRLCVLMLAMICAVSGVPSSTFAGSSADGTIIAYPATTLSTADGVWGWGPPAPNRPNEASITLNGVQINGIGHLMEVANGGKLYVYASLINNWYFWANGAFQLSGPPTAPNPVSLTLTPSSVPLPDNAPAGQAIATAAVTMSDGSLFRGAIQVSDTTGVFAVSGMNVVTARALTRADDGTHTTVVSPK